MDERGKILSAQSARNVRKGEPLRKRERRKEEERKRASIRFVYESGEGMVQYQDGDITGEIISAAIEVHKILGPGLLESVYRACLMAEFHERGLKFQQEMGVPISYKGLKINCGFRIDFLVEDKVVLELKSVDHILQVHESQVLTYLRVLEKKVGLLINFNVPILKNGIRRFVLNS